MVIYYYHEVLAFNLNCDNSNIYARKPNCI